MPLCAKCGEDNPDKAKFCLGCGQQLAVASEAHREVRKVVTLVFTDVSGSTAMGERLDPESLRRIMSRYFEAMRAIIERHEGTVEKFVGDAVLAVFGIPTLHEDDALRAVRAAAEMRDALAEINDELERDRGVKLNVRTGVNTGEVVAGDLALGEQFVTGDPVNIAARLEQNAPVGEILLGPQTYGLVRNAVKVEATEPLALKGKSEPLPAYRLVSVTKDAPAFARRLDAKLVGRDNELNVLRQSFGRATTERASHLFTILGSAGVGKSRLVAEFLAEVAGDAKVARGRCLSYGEGITFWALAEVVRDCLDLPEDARADDVRPALNDLLGSQRDAGRLIPLLLQMMSLGGGASAVEEIGWALRRVLETMAHESPLVVVLDDIHWGEPALLDTIEYIADWSRGAPILLLCIARPELLDQRPGWGGGKMNSTSLLLEPLGEGESDALVDALLGDAVLPRGTRAAIAEAAEGNPLFVEQMLEMLIDEGALVGSGSGWRSTALAGRIAVPPTIHALISARLDRLQGEERQVIERASVIGKTFYAGAVRHLSPQEAGREVSRHLMTLVRKELVRPDQEAFADDDAFKFRHILVRDAAYDSISKEIRADLHLRFGEWLEERVSDHLAGFEEILAYHLAQAHRYKKDLGASPGELADVGARASRHYEASAERAVARGDYVAASKLLRSALQVNGDPGARTRITLFLVETLNVQGAFAEALELIDALDPASDELTKHRIEITRALVELTVNDFIIPLEDLEERLIPSFERTGDAGWLARAWALVMHWYNGAADSKKMVAAAKKVVHYAAEAGAPQMELEGRSWIAAAYAFGDTPIPEAIEAVREQRRAKVGSSALDGFTYFSEGHLEAMRGNPELGRDLVERGRRPLEEAGLHYVYAMSSMVVAEIEIAARDLGRAEAVLIEGCEMLEQFGDKAYRSTLLATYGEVLCQMGRFDEAERVTLEAKELTIEDDAVSNAGWNGNLARVLASRGRFDEALALADEAVAIMARTDYTDFRARTLVQQAFVRQAAGLVAEAEQSLLAAREAYESKGAAALIKHVESLLAGLAGGGMRTV